MAHIKPDNLGVDFPNFNSSLRALTNFLVGAATGGRIRADKSGFVTVSALDNINLEINSGDRLDIVGCNGFGKSTLLRVLTGIYVPTSGSITRVGKIASLIDIGLALTQGTPSKKTSICVVN